MKLRLAVALALVTAPLVPVGAQADPGIIYIGPHHQIRVADPATGASRAVTGRRSLFGGYGDATWSPDGTRIAAIGIGKRRHRVLVVLDGDGSHERVLTSRTGFAHLPAWAPNGRTIAFMQTIHEPALRRVSCGRTATQLRLITADGRRNAPLFPDERTDCGNGPSTRAFWSPDGRYLAFESWETGLTTVSLDGEAQRIFCAVPDMGTAPTWIGGEVVFTGSLGGVAGMYACAPGSATARTLSQDETLAYQIASPNGRWLTGLRRGAIFLLDLTTGDLSQVPGADFPGGSSVYPIGPVWSPDSSKIAYSYEPDHGTAFIWTYNLETELAMKLSGTRGGIDPAWSSPRPGL